MHYASFGTSDNLFDYLKVYGHPVASDLAYNVFAQPLVQLSLLRVGYLFDVLLLLSD